MTLDLLNNENETATLGAALARLCQPGDLITLDGPLGVGKTALSKAIIQYFAPHETVTSPTFSLLQIYNEDNSCPIWHVDAYRIIHAQEVFDLGIEEVRDHVILLVEWSEKIMPMLHQPRFTICLDYDDHKPECRQVKIHTSLEDQALLDRLWRNMDVT